MKQEEKGITHRGARGHNWVTLFVIRLTVTLQLQMTSEMRVWHQLSLFYRLKDKELCWERRHMESSGTCSPISLYTAADRTIASVMLLSSFNITGNPTTPTLVNTNMFLFTHHCSREDTIMSPWAAIVSTALCCWIQSKWASIIDDSTVYSFCCHLNTDTMPQVVLTELQTLACFKLIKTNRQ